MNRIRTVAAAAEALEDLAQEFRNLCQAVTIPSSDLTLTSAVTKLRAVLGDRHLSVKLEVDAFAGTGPPSCEWTVWDGHAFFKGPTLDAAVNATVTAHAPPPTDGLQRAENVVAGATAIDF